MRNARFLSSLILLLCSLAGPACAAAYPVGTWFGEGEPYDKHQMWQEWFAADGNFRGLYRTCDKGQAHDTTQTGRWSIQGDQESIDILTVDGAAAPRTDFYKRLSFDGKKWVYRYLGNGYVFTAQRVDDKFEMPSCDTVS